MTERAAARHAQPWAWPLGAALAVAAITAAAVFFLGLTWPFVTLLIAVLGAVAIGAIIRLRVERHQHQAVLARRDAEEAVLAERLRLARDLHDIVSHGLGLITVRAATAAHLYARNGDAHALLAAVDDIHTISRTATVELRRMLTALRGTEQHPARHPADTLASLGDIVAEARRAGLKVTLHHEDLGVVSPGVQVAICRIVREGLANAARYAGRSAVDIRLARTLEGIRVSLTDDGPQGDWTATPGAGHGLIGLRERVTSLGGTLSAGPRETADGKVGFCLQATIPDSTSPEAAGSTATTSEAPR